MSTGAQRLKFGAPEETRTPKIWFLRPTRIPIPSPGLKYIMHEQEKIYVKDLYRLFCTEPYTTSASWVTTKSFVADPLLNPAEFLPDATLVPGDGIEPPTQGFSVLCSTN